MIVCHCGGVSDSAVRAAAGAGARSVSEAAALCGAGGDCGSCHGRLERLIAECRGEQVASEALR